MVAPRSFLKKIKPFSFLSAADLDTLIAGLEEAPFSKNSFCYRKGTPQKHVYLVFSGLIGLYDGEVLTDYVSRGELFGIVPAIHGAPTAFDAKALEASVCYLIDSKRFREVYEQDTRFASFFNTFIARRFHSFSRLARGREVYEEGVLAGDLGRVVSKKPALCGLRSTVEGAARIMDKSNVGSIVVVDQSAAPVGIFTNKDLRKVLIEGDKHDPVTRYMSSPVLALEADLPIVEGYGAMMDAGIDHLVVLQKGKVAGVLTSKDILSRLEPSGSILSLYRKITKADDLDELKTACRSTRMAVANMALKNLHFYDLSRMIMAVNDAVVKKVMELALREEEPGEFVWLQMGSAGRREQVIATDQDNAIACRDAPPLELARKVNDMLAQAGIPKCKADYMASNPRWNVPLATWKDYFTQWFNEPSPEHIRFLTVFLDLRPLCGDRTLFDELLEFIYSSYTNQAVRFLAHDATLAEPPIGIFGIKHLDKGVELKRFGIYPITNGIRVMALDHRVLSLGGTRERIEALGDKGALGVDLRNDLVEAYAFMQDLRLRHQAKGIVGGGEADNRITVEELDKMDLLVLKESLKIVSSFRKFLKSRYAVNEW